LFIRFIVQPDARSGVKRIWQHRAHAAGPINRDDFRNEPTVTAMQFQGSSAREISAPAFHPVTRHGCARGERESAAIIGFTEAIAAFGLLPHSGAFSFLSRVKALLVLLGFRYQLPPDHLRSLFPSRPAAS